MRGGGAGVPQHPFAKGFDETDLFCDGYECARQKQASFGVQPAYESLNATDFVAQQIDDGLVVELELAGGAMSTCRIANSSPPMRAMMSVSLTADRRRSATIFNSLSPVG